MQLKNRISIRDKQVLAMEALIKNADVTAFEAVRDAAGYSTRWEAHKACRNFMNRILTAMALEARISPFKHINKEG